MNEPMDSSNAIIRPPIAWILGFVVGLAFDRLYPLQFVPLSIPAGWVGGLVFAMAFALAMWGIVAITKAGSRVETTVPTTAIVETGPYRFTRNPIYMGFFLGLIRLAIGFDSLWVLAMLVPFYVVIRYGVVAREEAYLERKFGDIYRGYRSRVRRWL